MIVRPRICASDQLARLETLPASPSPLHTRTDNERVDNLFHPRPFISACSRMPL